MTTPSPIFTSTSNRLPVVPYQDYTTAKGDLVAFTRTSAAELGPRNITVNMVSAGLLRADDATTGNTSEDVFEAIRNVTPLRRVTTVRLKM